MATLVKNDKENGRTEVRTLTPVEVDDMVKQQLATGRFDLPGEKREPFPGDNDKLPLVTGSRAVTNFTEAQLEKMTREELEMVLVNLQVDVTQIKGEGGKAAVKADLINEILEVQGETE